MVLRESLEKGSNERKKMSICSIINQKIDEVLSLQKSNQESQEFWDRELEVNQKSKKEKEDTEEKEEEEAEKKR